MQSPVSKLFGATAKPEHDSPTELEQALEDFAGQREAALAAIRQLAPLRADALLTANEPEVDRLDALADKQHRIIERSDIALEQLKPRLTQARARVAEEADRQLRRQTSERLNAMAQQFLRDAPQFRATLQQFYKVAAVSEGLGTITNTTGIMTSLLKLLDEPEVIADGLSQRGEKVLTGTGPATYAGL